MTAAAVSGSWPSIDPHDRRLHVPKELLESAGPGWVSAAFCDLSPSSDPMSGLDAQLLHGDNVSILLTEGDRVRIRSLRHGYVGWTDRRALEEGSRSPTHRVGVPVTFLYPGPDMKLPRSGHHSMGAGLVVTGEAETRGTRFFLLDTGQAVIARHLVSVDQSASDYVSVAESLQRIPYLWGGDTAFGLDCAGLVGLCMRMAGKTVMRDSDMQAATIGEPVETEADWSNLQRGDLVFWRGHVAIAQGLLGDVQHIIHANGHTMDVTSEPAIAAVERIAHLYERPIGVRRPAMAALPAQ